ncbi:hypothetical protein ABZ671_05005 [Micromonospora sp. NPDC006766]
MDGFVGRTRELALVAVSRTGRSVDGVTTLTPEDLLTAWED